MGVGNKHAGFDKARIEDIVDISQEVNLATDRLHLVLISLFFSYISVRRQFAITYLFTKIIIKFNILSKLVIIIIQFVKPFISIRVERKFSTIRP